MTAPPAYRRPCWASYARISRSCCTPVYATVAVSMRAITGGPSPPSVTTGDVLSGELVRIQTPVGVPRHWVLRVRDEVDEHARSVWAAIAN